MSELLDGDRVRPVLVHHVEDGARVVVDELLLVAVLDGDQDAGEQVELVEVELARLVDVEHVERVHDLVGRQVGGVAHEDEELDVVERHQAVDVEHLEELEQDAHRLGGQEAVRVVEVQHRQERGVNPHHAPHLGGRSAAGVSAGRHSRPATDGGTATHSCRRPWRVQAQTGQRVCTAARGKRHYVDYTTLVSSSQGDCGDESNDLCSFRNESLH